MKRGHKLWNSSNHQRRRKLSRGPEPFGKLNRASRKDTDGSRSAQRNKKEEQRGSQMKRGGSWGKLQVSKDSRYRGIDGSSRGRKSVVLGCPRRKKAARGDYHRSENGEK